MAKTLWVTGAAGFLGRHVAKAYSKDGWRVYGLGLGSWDDGTPESWGLSSWTEASISVDSLSDLIELSSSPDAVVHCAGGSSVAFSITEPGKDFSWTVGTLAVLLEFLRVNAPTAKIVYPSSAAVYGLAGADILKESSSLIPCSPYGVHKRMAEELLHSYYQSFGLDSVVVRFFSLYGAGLRKQLLWDACKKLDSSSFEFGGTGKETRDFLYVSDAADLMLFLSNITKEEKPYRVVNGGYGLGTSVESVLTKLASIAGSDLHPVFNGLVRDGDPLHLVADQTQVEELGWSPSISLDEGLRKYCEWFRFVSSD